MNVALIHNQYQQPGGEDQVFALEGQLLEKNGHRICRYIVHNDDVSKLGTWELAGKTMWNSASYRKLRELFRYERPAIVHVHNTLPLISPSVYYAAKAESIPVVQTLHNFRLLCANALFFRDNHVCEDCLGETPPWPGVLHACYRDSRAASGVVAAMLTYHRLRKTYHKKVDIYIALTEFAKRKFIKGGLPEDRIVVKPNFLDPDPGMGKGRGGYALFVGRLSKEKGVSTMLSAWRSLKGRLTLKIVGDGPLAPQVERAIGKVSGVEWLGRLPREGVLVLMKDARVLVLPSVCYENFPNTLVEAFATGLPVVASNLGSMASLVDHERTGLHIKAGDPKDFAAKIEWVLTHPSDMACMRKEARAEFEAKYTAEQNYRQLMEVYEKAALHSR